MTALLDEHQATTLLRVTMKSLQGRCVRYWMEDLKGFV